MQRFTLLPDGETLKAMSLGFEDVMADIIWLQAIQAIGERCVSDDAGQWIYRAMDIVTTLDSDSLKRMRQEGQRSAPSWSCLKRAIPSSKRA